MTFRRPDSLLRVLEGLAAQDAPPSIIAIADNDPGRSADAAVEQFRHTSGLQVLYVPIGRNLGPAGGWAEAVEHLRSRPDRGTWVAIFDDDDPIEHPTVMRSLLDVADRCGSEVAAAGLRGAVLRRPWATLHRQLPGSEQVDVDYLAGGGAPLYRWEAIDQLGFFDGELFFGFEDLELGLRMRLAGKRLIVVNVAHHDVADTATNRSAWREYFKTRALVTIARRHLGWPELAITIVRAVLVGGPVIAIRSRDASIAVARLRGAIDALRGQLGPGGYAPAANPPK